MNMFDRPHGVDYPGARAALRGRAAPATRSSSGHRMRLKTRVGDEEGDGAEIDSRHRSVGGRQLVRARDLRHVRRHVRGPPRSAPHPDVPGVRGAPAAQGLPGREDAAARRSTATSRTSTSSRRSAPTRACPSVARPTSSASYGEDDDVPHASQGHQRPRDELSRWNPSIKISTRASSSCRPSRCCLNMGPSHPAMHGTVRIVLELSGETIVKSRRADRLPAPRLREDVRARHLDAGLPVRRSPATTSRRCSTTSASRWRCEKMLGITVPERCQYYRMILGELARICDHLTCNGAMAMELGAFTPFLWMHQGARDDLGHPRGGDRRAPDAQLRPRRRHGEAADRRLQGARPRAIVPHVLEHRRRGREAAARATASSSTASRASA